MPNRLKLSRRRGAALPKGARSVARPSRFGNPFRVVPMPDGTYRVSVDEKDADKTLYRIFINHPGPRISISRRQAHQVAVDCYRALRIRRPLTADQIENLRGRHLACYCPEHLPCHADVLLDIANP